MNEYGDNNYSNHFDTIQEDQAPKESTKRRVFTIIKQNAITSSDLLGGEIDFPTEPRTTTKSTTTATTTTRASIQPNIEIAPSPLQQQPQSPILVSDNTTPANIQRGLNAPSVQQVAHSRATLDLVGLNQSRSTKSAMVLQQPLPSPSSPQPSTTNNITSNMKPTYNITELEYSANLSPNTSSNNLTVGSQHLAHRKSVLGRQLIIERSSFQAQRLSDVGIAFGQQITAKMGLKLPASQERIVEQTRWLYLRYVLVKLRQNALPIRDLNLTKSSRRRRAAATGATTMVAPEITCSAPATATATSSDQFEILKDQLSRKRNTLSQGDNLTLLTARIKSIKQSFGDEPLMVDDLNGAKNNAAGKRFFMDPTINSQIFNVVSSVIRELRDMKPDFYGDTVYELIGIDKFSSLESLLDVQRTICQEMTRSEISWCRIAALFSLVGAMSLDCVRIGAPEHVGPIADGFVGFVERDLALWISQQGGWETFSYQHRGGFRLRHWTAKAVTLMIPILIWAIISVFR